MYLTQGLHRSLQQDPDGIATIDGARTRTFAELAGRVARLAGGLRAAGVEAGDRVAYLGVNSDRYHEFYLATAWAGAVAVPLNTRWAPAEIAFALADCRPRLLVVDDTRLPVVDDLPDRPRLVHAGDGPPPEGMLSFDALATETEPVDDVGAGGDALAGIFYTGGTTGFPKGVMLSHANLLANAFGALAVDAPGPGGRILHVAPMFHIADYAGTVAVNVLGGTHVILPGYEPVATMAAVARHRVTDLALIPIMLQMLVDHPALAEHDLSSLRVVMYGGSSITVPVVERVRKALPGVALLQAFGQTESSPVLTWLGRAEHEDPEHPERLASAGRAALHTEVRIVDEDGGEVPRGTAGEIVARGANVMLGYWDRAAETAAALRDGWLHTGDVGRMDDHGYVYVLDRLKDMIVTGGENVYCAEVESAIAAHPAVATCSVIGLPDPQWGERVHAVVVLVPGARATAEEIRAHTRTRIAGYKTPQTVAFAAALPVSAAGKVLKRELRAQIAAG